ncbi:MAG: thioredoxin family protein [Bacillota bacterium]|nr:thioredoxin family protein [Bacillota bacterium]
MIPGVRLIYIDGTSRGLVDLEQTYRETAQLGIADPDSLGEALVARAAERNYVPAAVRVKYAKALLVDYRLWRGEITADEARRAGGALEVRVLGAGCPQCDRLENMTLEILAELGEAADVVHVRDPQAIADFGLVAVPALVINGRVVSSGHVPGRAALTGRIRRALDETR